MIFLYKILKSENTMSVRNIVFKLKDGRAGFINLNKVAWLYLKHNNILIRYQSDHTAHHLYYKDKLKAEADFNKIITENMDNIRINPDEWR